MGKHLGNTLELGGALRLGRCRKLADDPFIPVNVSNDSLKADNRSLEEVILRLLRKTMLCLGQHTAKATLKNEREITDDMALPLVRLSNREDLGLLGLEDFFICMSRIPVIQRLARPEGIKHLAVIGLILLRHLELVLRTRREIIKFVEDPVGRHLGRNNTGARRGSAVANEQIILVDDNLVVGQKVGKGLGPADNSRLALSLLVALHIERRALKRHLAGVLEKRVLDGLRASSKHLSSHRQPSHKACFVSA